MLVLAAVHVHPLISLVVAAAVLAWIAWYWIVLGRDKVPPSRRRIRRASLLMIGLSLPMFVRALSFLDPTVQQREYVITWTVAMAMVVIVAAIAAVDALNSVRLVQKQAHDEMREAASELSKAIKSREQSQRPALHRPTKNGERAS